MPDRIRLGFVGANVRSRWSSVSHFPALAASPDVELTAVCTTRAESAEEARAALGARLAFHDVREMVASPEIDAVAIVVKVPEHLAATTAALEAGKHVYTEWPLGKSTAEAEQLDALARSKGVRTVIGLQSRVSPTLMFMKERIEDGYLGDILTCHVTSFRDAYGAAMPSSRTWAADARLGSNTLTIVNGHVIDALRFVAGDFARIRALLATQTPEWHETDTGRTVEVTSPDNVLVSGQLVGGATASVHAAAVPSAGTGFRMEIYGREGAMIATNSISSQRGEAIELRTARNGHDLLELPVPDRFRRVPNDFPRGDPYNVGQMYSLFADAIRRGESAAPTFGTAVELHRLIDAIQQSSDTGTEVILA